MSILRSTFRRYVAVCVASCVLAAPLQNSSAQNSHANDSANDSKVQPLEQLLAAACRAVAVMVRQTAGGAKSNIEASPPDPRLRLPYCPSVLRTRVPANLINQERLLVQVACETGPRWRVNVPVRVSTERAVLIARKSLPRGALLDPLDFSSAHQLQGGVSSDLIASADLAGERRLQRAIATGTVLSYSMLEPLLAVRRGQQVVLLVSSANFEIRSSGRALQDARAGERLRVENLATRRVVEGTATGDAIVAVQP